MTPKQLMAKPKILFLCTGNACRSQMAEAWTRHLWNHLLEPFSAGTTPTRVDPLAIQVMQEAGLDISWHRSKNLTEFTNMAFQYVITVCDNAHQACPIFPAQTMRLHQSFPDPPHLTRNAKTPQEALPHYRRTRDQIRSFIETLPQLLHL